jgi:two-component system, NtrC family, response regulator GlrR
MGSVPLIGCSEAHQHLMDVLKKVAPTDAEVLITGPTGVGKELYAQYVHNQSRRKNAPFVAINCGALPHDLFENELFGHVGGAFTGARPVSEGLVANAEHGTLFLDEINSLSPPCQVKLLRFLQDKEYRRLGESRLRRADVRIISATNADLVEATRSGFFREDLLFRLRVFPVDVPPLAERPDDISPLLEAYTDHYATSYRLPKISLTKHALHRLSTYSWPGNVRELQNCIKYLTCMQLPRPVGVSDLNLLSPGNEADPEATVVECGEQKFGEAKRELVDTFERTYLESVLKRSNGNITRAARASGKSRRAFFELLRKHGINGGKIIGEGA